MDWFNNLKIGTKLVVSFISVILVAAAIGVIGIINISALTKSQKDAYQFNTVPISILGYASAHYQQIQIDLRNTIIDKEKSEMEKFAESVHNEHKAVAEKLSQLDKIVRLPDQRKVYDQVVDEFNAYGNWENKLIALSHEHKEQEAMAVLQSDAYKKSTKVIRDGLTKLQDMKTATSNVKALAGEKMGNTAERFMMLLVLVGMAIAAGLAFFLANSISRPLREAVNISNRMADGDLTVVIGKRNRDEAGQLLTAMEHMAGKLNVLISRVAQNGGQVAAAVGRFQASSEQIAIGAQDAASRIGSIAVAGEEMTSTSCEISQNCSVAANGSGKANESAASGAAVVQETVDVMNNISEQVKESARTVGSLGERSDQIGDIIGTIEDIADQTNLLALNAAIEAARAGEQGRGFAVVADEVRALAERTTKATKEIGLMIKSIQQETKLAVGAMEEGVRQVESGRDKATRSGSALSDILDQINNVTGQVNQIATAAEEQTSTTREISCSLQQLTEVVNGNASNAQESSRAALDLATLAAELQQLAGQFRLAA